MLQTEALFTIVNYSHKTFIEQAIGCILTKKNFCMLLLAGMVDFEKIVNTEIEIYRI
jgi:hypothetical protein